MSFNPRQIIGIDSETTGLRYWHNDEPFSVPIADQDGNTEYFEWFVDPFTREVFPNPKDVAYLRKLFGNPKIVKWFFNLKFDLRMLEKSGIEVTPPYHDGLIAARVCNTIERTYQLKPLAKKYAGIPDNDEKLLQLAVTAARRKGKTLGWSLYTYGDSPAKADYWMCRAVDRSNNICEQYARTDAIRTIVLGIMYQEIMDSDPVLKATYEREMQLFPEIMAMELRGVALDVSANSRELARARQEKEYYYQEMLKFLKKERIQWWAVNNWVEFNPRSAPQLYRILFSDEGLGLKVYGYADKGKSKNPSLAWEDLKPHVSIPFVQYYLRHKRAEKEDTSFFGKFDILKCEDHLVPGGWCLHTRINQSEARTLRLSSSDPNTQNFASKKTAARSYEPIEARVVLTPRPGYRWYKLDYSQQEIRIFAELSQSAPMLETLFAGGDINTANANLLWGGDNEFAYQAAAQALELGVVEPSSDIIKSAWKEINWNGQLARTIGAFGTRANDAARNYLSNFAFDIVNAEAVVGKKNSRTRAKNCFYATIYGGGPKAVMGMMYCTEEEARSALQRFYQMFPDCDPKNRNGFVRQLISQAKKDGYVTTIYGDRLQVERGYEYKAVNYIVQGSAAGMMKDSMRRVGPYLRKTGLDANMVLSVHDELDLEIKKEHCYMWLLRQVRDIMKDNGNRVRVPMEIECERVTKNWGDSVKVKL